MVLEFFRDMVAPYAVPRDQAQQAHLRCAPLQPVLARSCLLQCIALHTHLCWPTSHLLLSAFMQPCLRSCKPAFTKLACLFSMPLCTYA